MLLRLAGLVALGQATLIADGAVQLVQDLGYDELFTTIIACIVGSLLAAGVGGLLARQWGRVLLIVFESILTGVVASRVAYSDYTLGATIVTVIFASALVAAVFGQPAPRRAACNDRRVFSVGVESRRCPSHR